MPQLLEGKTAVILGVANKWSLAYAIAQAFRREGATLLLTYQGERLKKTVEELGAELGAAKVIECDVAKDEDLARLTETCQRTDASTPWSTPSASPIARIWSARSPKPREPATCWRRTSARIRWSR